MATQLNELGAVIVQHINKELPDGLEKINPLWYHFMNGGKKKVSGGTLLQAPIKLLKNQSQAFIPGAGAIVDTTPSIQLQYAVFNWKYNYYSANFTLEDFTVAGGDTQILDFVKEKKDGALADYYRDMSVAVHGTSTTNTLSFDGMQDIVAASGTAYGGLTDTDYTDATEPYLPYISTETVMSYTTVSDLITNARARTQRMGGTGKMLGLCNPHLWNKLLSVVQGQQVFTKNDMTVKAGFQGININGVDIYMDVDCPGTADGSTEDNFFYIIPEEVVKFNYKFGLGSKSIFDGSIRLPNQPTLSAQGYMAGNLVCTNRRQISVCKTFK